LGDRYNAAYLNGLPLPSPDPDNKVAPLDIFPTDVVGSIAVTKGFSPELYGDFSGGVIDIRTKRGTDKST
jgi:outer membrane receptor protein involved in Fe transport